MDRREKIEEVRNKCTETRIDISTLKDKIMVLEDEQTRLKQYLKSYEDEFAELSQDITDWECECALIGFKNNKIVSTQTVFNKKSSGTETDVWGIPHLEDLEDALIYVATGHLENNGPMNNNIKYDSFIITINRLHADPSNRREIISTLEVPN